MRDFQNAFDAALAGVDSTIVEVMGLCAQFTSGAQCGSEVQGVFDDPESLGFAGGGVRIEGSSPSLFVRTDTVRAVRRGDTLTINGETFWVDRVSPDDGGSCYLWLNRGQPPAVPQYRSPPGKHGPVVYLRPCTRPFQPAFREHQAVPAVVVPKDLLPPSRARARKRKPAHRRAPEAAVH